MPLTQERCPGPRQSLHSLPCSSSRPTQTDDGEDQNVDEEFKTTLTVKGWALSDGGGGGGCVVVTVVAVVG